MGDGKPHTAFKRANVTKEVGENALDELIDTGIIRLEKSKKIFTSWADNEAISNKLYFTSPFLRFWFAFVSPLFKGIRDGDYKEIRERFTNRESEFTHLTFTQLTHEFLKLANIDDPIVEIGSYWDNDVEIDIYAKTKSGKTIAGTTKYTNAKIKKSELTRVQEMCDKTNMKVDMFVIFSKRGFTSELKSLKGENLRLYTVKNLKKLVE
jgi:AAA+ ATPase superfamily predicted ATPase